MSKKIFAQVINTIDSSIPADKIDVMFEDACEWAHESVLHTLRQLWQRIAYNPHTHEYSEDFDRFSDDENDLNSISRSVATPSGRTIKNSVNSQSQTQQLFYYVNLKTKKTQWTRPYHERTFFSNDIEIDAFIAIILKYDIFANR